MDLRQNGEEDGSWTDEEFIVFRAWDVNNSDPLKE